MPKTANTNIPAKAKKPAQPKHSTTLVKLEGARKKKPVEFSDVEVEEDDEGSPSKVLF